MTDAEIGRPPEAPHDLSEDRQFMDWLGDERARLRAQWVRRATVIAIVAGLLTGAALRFVQ